MANQILNVPVIEKEFENQLVTKLNIDQFLKLDDTLTKNEGDTRVDSPIMKRSS